MVRQLNAQQQMQHWQALLDSAGEGIWGLDLKGNCTFVNRMAMRLFGFSTEELLGKNMHTLVHHTREDGSPFPDEACPIYNVLRRNESFSQRKDMLFRKDGTPFVAEVSAQPVAVEGEVVGVVVTFRDVTEARAQELRSQESYEQAAMRTAELNAVIESIPHGVYVATRDGGLRTNRRARDLSGDMFPAQLGTLSGALRGECLTEVVHTGERWIRSVGAPVLLDGAILGGVAVNTDITQTRQQEEALRRSEKLAAVGQLASSIAHEINNPLEAITNLLYLVRCSDTMDEVHQYAAMAQSELARVTEITLQTLRFHRQHSKATSVDLAELTRAVMTLYTGRLLVRSVAVEWKIAPSPSIICLEGEIRQVLNNLVRNALDAQQNGGRLMLRVHPQFNWKTGAPGVRLTVADTGEGIRPSMAGRLFEPFQTTKEATGTGLGLWVSKGIVEKHGGRIQVRSRTDEAHGTVFSVWLPLQPVTTLAAAETP